MPICYTTHNAALMLFTSLTTSSRRRLTCDQDNKRDDADRRRFVALVVDPQQIADLLQFHNKSYNK